MQSIAGESPAVPLASIDDDDVHGRRFSRGVITVSPLHPKP